MQFYIQTDTSKLSIILIVMYPIQSSVKALSLNKILGCFSRFLQLYTKYLS